MKKALLLGLMVLGSYHAFSQHNHHGMSADSNKTDTMKMDMAMSHAYSLNLPMNRNGSGTGWLPDESPMYGYMMHAGNWMFMLHGNIFLRYNKQDLTNKGSRGSGKFDIPNWFMFMGQRKVGMKGLFHFSIMPSLDYVIAGGSGYPLLFQTGESWQGKPLVDRQHPHDLFSELSMSYAYSFTKKFDAFIYAGYPGEPALGSVAFMHRPSALYNPDAPLSHHWNDGTHITFGVITIGVRYDKFKIEASSFTGREPDENRYAFDKPHFDSKSVRLSYNPSRNWALQVSQAFIKSPEAMHPLEDMNRTTASAVYTSHIGGENFFHFTGLWGLNNMGNDHENAVLLESALTLKRIAVYGRYEWVQKSTEELNLDEMTYGHTLFPINAVTAGLSYDLLHSMHLNAAIGGQVSAFFADDRLDNLYGNNPLSAEVFIRIYPPRMMMSK